LVNPEYLSGKLAGKRIDFVVNYAGLQTVYDQTVIHCTRTDAAAHSAE
jgi:hypothetical protein